MHAPTLLLFARQYKQPALIVEDMQKTMKSENVMRLDLKNGRELNSAAYFDSLPQIVFVQYFDERFPECVSKDYKTFYKPNTFYNRWRKCLH